MVDTINNHNGKLNEIYKWTAKNFLKILPEETEINWIRLTRAGIKIKRINKMKIKDEVRKSSK